ncbi:MAG: TetR/AcrR family transcriptional regulator [Actinobacteria bacterium]|nr:TetR/AcrR family transcriptional regulator [Actinomycetota bacterium]
MTTGTQPASPQPTGVGGRTLSSRGLRTRGVLLEAAERVFAELGYHDASIVKITEAAGVGQGTFYLYFDGKKRIFDELVLDLNARVRRAMTAASSQGSTRAESELLGFGAFFRFTADHPALYRIIRQAEFVSPEILQLHYERLTEGYVAGLRQAMADGEVAAGDPEVLAWSLMGIGELVGMRWILWDGDTEMPERVFAELARIVVRAIGARELDA